jgi:hypothetical protein
MAAIFGLFISVFPAYSQNFSDPGTTVTFDQAIQGMEVIDNYTFGTGYGRTISNIQQLAAHFDPYGIAGTQVINQEWERYQPFNNQNFAFADSSLNLTATIPKGGGVFPGGIYSGQIFSKQLFKPEVTGHTVYAFEVRMKVPIGPGMWPAAWFYTQHWGQDDRSEIDNPEFFNMKWQNEFDWTGSQHGPGQGAEIYSIKTNPWTWHPGLNFSADYHDYQTLWTPDAVYKYVDGTLVYAQSFKWTAPGPAQIIVNLAVGSSDTQSLPGLEPTSLSQFPSALSVDHIRIWAK